jgi:hypothetical protein
MDLASPSAWDITLIKSMPDFVADMEMASDIIYAY